MGEPIAGATNFLARRERARHIRHKCDAKGFKLYGIEDLLERRKNRLNKFRMCGIWHPKRFHAHATRFQPSQRRGDSDPRTTNDKILGSIVRRDGQGPFAAGNLGLDNRLRGEHRAHRPVFRNHLRSACRARKQGAERRRATTSRRYMPPNTLRGCGRAPLPARCPRNATIQPARTQLRTSPPARRLYHESALRPPARTLPQAGLASDVGTAALRIHRAHVGRPVKSRRVVAPSRHTGHPAR